MKCTKCSSIDSKVVDSRLTQDSTSIRRRRECLDCAFRFTTYEYILKNPIMVVKKTGVREEFDRKKIEGIESRLQSIVNFHSLREIKDFIIKIPSYVNIGVDKSKTPFIFEKICFENLLSFKYVKDPCTYQKAQKNK